MRAADALKAIAVEIFKQCERSGQRVAMNAIPRVLEQLRAPDLRKCLTLSAPWINGRKERLAF